MGRERRPADWAAWMESGRAPAPASASESELGAGRDEALVQAPSPALSPAPAGLIAFDAAAHGEPDTAGDAPRSARREVTRRRILDAAREVFAEMGVIGGTVEDICERAGFTRGAFYSNFGDKDEVLDALVEREHNLLVEHLESSFVQVDRQIAEAPDVVAVVSSLVEQLLRSVPVDRQLSLIQTELEIFAIRRPEVARRFVEANTRFRVRIGELMAAAMARNGRELLVDPSMLTDAIVAIAERSVRRALLAGGGADPDEMAAAILPGLVLAFSRPVTTP